MIPTFQRWSRGQCRRHHCQSCSEIEERATVERSQRWRNFYSKLGLSSERKVTHTYCLKQVTSHRIVSISTLMEELRSQARSLSKSRCGEELGDQHGDTAYCRS